ncbi:SAV_2336 N-terminal domain-related protein [Streptomyces chrestomyceticus]|uniref:SAV_2336 N-terminal domain-related protein n=1 Tax=Streptomyces chrestomyceticus TaxID=68185 RepID=UPI0019D2C01C|nr:SAV_2336 N-terminal domain-related protein [Streptomyces chrestomyceticus]
MPAGGPGFGPLGEIVARLRAAGLPADARSMADALWLARWITPAPSEGDEGPADGTVPAAVQRPKPATFSVDPRSREPARDTPSRTEPAARDRPRRPEVDLLPAQDDRTLGPGQGRLGEVGIPVASAFPGLLPLQRALRPVQRYHPPVAPARQELDEAATADLSAHAELIIPVLRGVRRRAASLRLLMDGSSSMAVWEQMLHDLRQVCERVGAFRDVTVHYLHPHGDEVGVAAGPGRDAPLRPADQLHDPTGHHLTLVVSDCAGPLWRDGRIQRLLYRWAADAPLAVVQPLPQRMWARTLLPAVAGTLVRRQGPYSALGFRPARRRRRAPSASGRPQGEVRERAVPVLSAAPAALGSWARLAAAESGLSLRGAAAVVRSDHGLGTDLVRRTDRPEPADLVREFEQAASPDARHLAVHLSAVPLALPVIQLVQRAMLPQTGPAELAEVLLSGLVEQLPDPTGGPAHAGAAGGPWYEFVPGVRDELLSRLSAGEAALVLKHCSLYIERTFGRSARNFPAVAVAMLSGSGREPTTGQRAVPEPFARISERVLRRFEPALRTPAPPPYAPDGPAAEGAALLERYEQDGAVRDLMEAVRLLRAAARQLPAAGTDLARALLHGWAEWRQPDALEEAERSVRAAAEAVGDDPAQAPDGDGEARVRALIVLARVRYAAAQERGAAGYPDGERSALEDAARHLDTACGLMSLLDPRVLESMVLRTEVLRRLAALAPATGAAGRPGDPLDEAEHALTVLLEQWPSGEQVPGEIYAARGGVLLDQARRAAGAESGTEAHTGALALRATADLDAATVLLRRKGGAADRKVCETLLELAQARSLLGAGTGPDTVLPVLALARALARELRDPALEAESLTRTAAAHRAVHTRTGDAAALDKAIEALAAALRLITPDSPEHSTLLAERGAALLLRARLEPPGEHGKRLANEAVHVLREALGRVAPNDPELGAHRLLFGRALRLRHDRQPSLADLHEADWVLELAARSSHDPAVAAEAWLEVGDVQLALDRRFGSRERHDRAAACYRRAAADADRAGSPLLAARAHHRRAGVLEDTAGPQAALVAYRESWEQWQHAAEENGPEARRTRERMRALDPSE